MNAIIGYTNLAMKEAESGPVHDYLEKIILSSQHLLNLINDILEMSRIESGKLELEFIPMDLCEMVDGIRDLFQEQMNQKKIDFQVHTSQIQHRYVWCDKKNLSRVLLNVLSNAYKFTPEGGKITASVLETGSTDDGVASYEIRILDTGIGMSKEFAEKMFNAFERERTSTASGIDGTGLGLSITKSIVDLMGGTIEVLTAPGSGTEESLQPYPKCVHRAAALRHDPLVRGYGGELGNVPRPDPNRAAPLRVRIALLDNGCGSIFRKEGPELVLGRPFR